MVEIKTKLSEYLRLVKAGTEFIITEEGFRSPGSCRSMKRSWSPRSARPGGACCSSLLLPEPRSTALVSLLTYDRETVIWWATPLECQSAIYRRHHETPLPPAAMTQATERMRAFVEHADAVAPTDDVRRRAARLLAGHPLRAADALQLAAALIWCEEQPHNETFVSLDERLRSAARKEGFDIAP